MSVYVDPLFKVHPAMVKNAQARRLTEKHGEWCHMIADTQEELIDFAVRMGMRYSWIQKPNTPEVHFDLVPSRRTKAIRMGAIEITQKELVARINGKRTGQPVVHEPKANTLDEIQINGELFK